MCSSQSRSSVASLCASPHSIYSAQNAQKSKISFCQNFFQKPKEPESQVCFASGERMRRADWSAGFIVVFVMLSPLFRLWHEALNVDARLTNQRRARPRKWRLTGHSLRPRPPTRPIRKQLGDYQLEGAKQKRARNNNERADFAFFAILNQKACFSNCIFCCFGEIGECAKWRIDRKKE